MKYLCLVYSNEQLLHSLPDSPQDAECQAYAGLVAQSGRMLAAEALQSVATASTVRVRSGQVMLSDGPFAETKEQLADSGRTLSRPLKNYRAGRQSAT